MVHYLPGRRPKGAAVALDKGFDVTGVYGVHRPAAWRGLVALLNAAPARAAINGVGIRFKEDFKFVRLAKGQSSIKAFPLRLPVNALM